jgi:proline iminopeptidase
VRNRGRSDLVRDGSKTIGDIHSDVEDLEAVRLHFGPGKVDVIGHSYIGLMVGLYAMKYPDHLSRMVQISPEKPHAATQYPAELSWDDGKVAAVFGRLGQMLKALQGEDPVEACRKAWDVLREIYVADPGDAGKIDWGRCDLPNELNFRIYWAENIVPSIQRLALTPGDFAKAPMPILVVHGKKDRSAPYGGGREWALMWPDARLFTIENAAHAPWIEAPDQAFEAMETFLDGSWPESAEKVTLL